MKYYAGIGSRDTPEDICDMMAKIGLALSNKGFILRSGGAQGADQAFEREELFAKQIYTAKEHSNIAWANVFTEHFHPNPKALKEYPRKLMNRNALQILGDDGNTPVQFVVCWTKDGKASGGTGQAIRIAQYFNIPIYNLKNEDDIEGLRQLVRSL